MVKCIARRNNICHSFWPDVECHCVRGIAYLQTEHFTIVQSYEVHGAAFYPFRIINPIRDCTLCFGSYIQIRYIRHNGNNIAMMYI